MLTVAACGSDDGDISATDSIPPTGSTEPITSTEPQGSALPTPDSPDTTDAPTVSAPVVESTPGDKDPAEPAPSSRRTELADVDLLDPSSPGGSFPRAAVPVEAFPAADVLVEPADSDVEAVAVALAEDGHVVIPAVIETCTLVAVWALPRPEELVVGYEEHPNIDCVRSVPRTVLFTIPVTGENSEGAWDYSSGYEVTLERRVG
jgi:hypothetical protein